MGIGTFERAVGHPDTYWPLIIRGFSIGFLFVPVNQLAIGSLQADQVNQGTGLLGLAGSSAARWDRDPGDIPAKSPAPESRQPRQRSDPAHPAYIERLSGLTETLTTHGYSLADAQHGALSLMERVLTQQAAALSFNDSFLVLMVISLAMIPTLLLLKKPKPGASAAAMH